jgi:hypothetical protein
MNDWSSCRADFSESVHVRHHVVSSALLFGCGHLHLLLIEFLCRCIVCANEWEGDVKIGEISGVGDGQVCFSLIYLADEYTMHAQGWPPSLLWPCLGCLVLAVFQLLRVRAIAVSRCQSGSVLEHYRWTD